jgi:hypothetical protein
LTSHDTTFFIVAAISALQNCPMPQKIRSRRLALIGLTVSVISAGFALSGCGAEPKQRKSFIAFLQTRVLGSKRSSVPRLTTAEKEEFGIYASHYEVISDFTQEVKDIAAFKAMEEIGGRRMHSLPQLIEKRASLQKMQTLIKPGSELLQAALDKANNRKAALAQPQDLQTVFDASFQKLVDKPAGLMLKLLPAMGRMLIPTMDLLALIDRHPAEISVRGLTVEVHSQRMMNQVNALIQKIQTEGAEMDELQKALRAMVG